MNSIDDVLEDVPERSIETPFEYRLGQLLRADSFQLEKEFYGVEQFRPSRITANMRLTRPHPERYAESYDGSVTLDVGIVAHDRKNVYAGSIVDGKVYLVGSLSKSSITRIE